MTAQRILTLIFAAILLAEAKLNTKKGDTDTICDGGFNTTNQIQCYCTKEHNSGSIRAADCSLNRELDFSSEWWQAFSIFKTTKKLTLTNAKGIPLKYIPTNALKHTHSLHKLEVKYGHLEKIQPYAFANLSALRELILSDNKIQSMDVNAFADHLNLTSINLDKNNIEEIKRDVFVHLPSLEKLFLTSNKISIIHDKAFAHLRNLKELELNINEMISLNSESFYGLKNLQRLDLSSNNLEVVGDNTFVYLENLLTLNLEGNKIQMLDDRAFQGLHKLRHLSLAHNKIEELESSMLFQGLNKLSSISFKANEFKDFPTQVMTPILKNFFEANANLDVEDNPFSCKCSLIWFASLMNKTKSTNLKIAMDNIKCVPSAELREAWSKVEEKEQNSRPVYENPENQPGQDYEYYDETQLNGKLFFTDIKDLINCTINKAHINALKPENIPTVINEPNTDLTRDTPSSSTNEPDSDDRNSEKTSETTSSILMTTLGKTTEKTKQFIYLNTHKPSVTTVDDDAKNEKDGNNTSPYTTSRLATVSAKPIEEDRTTKTIEDGPIPKEWNTNYIQETSAVPKVRKAKKTVPEDRMASDEAIPDKTTHRSIQQEYKSADDYRGASHRNLASLLHISVFLFFRVVY